MGRVRGGVAGNDAALSGEGYWSTFGAKPSTVDWCEQNYVWSPFVCEFHNTWSSFAMIFLGIFGIVAHWRILERRFLVAYLCIAIVGVGSAAFHATLLFATQASDEVPMLWSALTMTYILVENKKKNIYRWLPAAMLAYGFLVSCAFTLTEGKVQFYTFHVSFGSLEFFSLYKVWKLPRADEIGQRLFRLGFMFYASALVCWLLDINFCVWLDEVLPSKGIPNPQLHAFWHIFVSLGLVFITLHCARWRISVTTGAMPEICWIWGVIPRIRALPGDPKATR